MSMSKIVNVALLALVSLVSGCTTVETGYIGVDKSMGEVITTHTYGEGFHLIPPWHSVHEMSVRLQPQAEDDVPCRSLDNVSIQADITVQYALRRGAAPVVLKRLGDDYAATVVQPSARSAIRDAIARVDALHAAQAREELERSVEDTLRRSIADTLRGQGLPANAINISGVQLRNLDLPQSLTESIESITRQQNLTRVQQMAIETARREAERRTVEVESATRIALMEAERAAQVRRIAGDSEAEYNRTVNASLSPNLIELRRIEAQRQIVQNPNAHLVIMGGGNAPVLLNPMAPGR